jgi:hypothetical protein
MHLVLACDDQCLGCDVVGHDCGLQTMQRCIGLLHKIGSNTSSGIMTMPYTDALHLDLTTALPVQVHNA